MMPRLKQENPYFILGIFGTEIVQDTIFCIFIFSSESINFDLSICEMFFRHLWNEANAMLLVL